MASIGESDVVLIYDVDMDVSRAKFDSHANMMVLGKYAHVIASTGRTAEVQQYSPNYKLWTFLIVDAAIIHECPCSGRRVLLVV